MSSPLSSSPNVDGGEEEEVVVVKDRGCAPASESR